MTPAQPERANPHRAETPPVASRTASGLARVFPIVEHAALANAITMLSAILGVSGLLLCSHELALPAILCGAAAIPCDVLDGMVARRRGTTGAFGATLDTLADATSFCLLPALIGHALGLPVWVAPLQVLYAIAGLGRLARYGEVGLAPVGGRETFEGFPTPFAAGWFYVALAVAVWLGPPYRDVLLPAYYALAAAGMVCALRIPKKGLHVKLSWVLIPLAIAAIVVKLA